MSEFIKYFFIFWKQEMGWQPFLETSMEAPAAIAIAPRGMFPIMKWIKSATMYVELGHKKRMVLPLRGNNTSKNRKEFHTTPEQSYTYLYTMSMAIASFQQSFLTNALITPLLHKPKTNFLNSVPIVSCNYSRDDQKDSCSSR